MSVESMMLFNHLNLCRFLFLSSIFPRIRVFPNELALHIRWPKYWSFSLSLSPSHEYSGLISFRIDWFALLDVQETLKYLLPTIAVQLSILWHSAFFTVQLSLSYMTTRKTIALTVCTFVGKVMFLLFNMLSRFVITFLPRSKRLLISRLQSLSRWFWSPRKKTCHCFNFSLSILPWSNRTGYCDFCFLNVEF